MLHSLYLICWVKLNLNKMTKEKQKGIFVQLDNDTYSNLILLQGDLLKELRDSISRKEIIRRCINIIYDKAIKKKDSKIFEELARYKS